MLLFKSLLSKKQGDYTLYIKTSYKHRLSQDHSLLCATSPDKHQTNDLHSVISTDMVDSTYLLWFGCTLPTSLCCPVVRQHKHNSNARTQTRLVAEMSSRRRLEKGFVKTARGRRSRGRNRHLPSGTTKRTMKGRPGIHKTRAADANISKRRFRNLTSQRATLLTPL